MTTTYPCYGLTVRSDIPLPDLGTPLPDGSSPDVVVRLAPLERPGDAVALPLGLWRTGDACGVEIPEVGRFEARGGTEILLDPFPGVPLSTVRLYLLGTMMGALMMQRGHLVLHGNALHVGDACVVVLGHSGSGKSTLAAEFDRRGYRVLSDDVVPIDADGCALPGYPRIKLWDDALTTLGRTSDGLERIREEDEKFHVPLERSTSERVPVRWLYVLERHSSDDLEILDEGGAGAFSLLREHTYRSELVSGPDATARHLEQCAALLRKAWVARIRRPAEAMTARQTADAILADITRDDPHPREQR